MHKLRHFYYQNKEKIWKVALLIAFLLGIIYFLNSQAIKSTNKNSNKPDTNSVNYSDNKNKTYISNTSAISGGTVNQEKVEKINSTISKFLQYCKSENYEEAYNMISSDCKQKRYKTLEEFTNKYVKTKFNKSYVYEIEEWIGNTYRVSISEDKLATGEVGNDKKLVEYITIVREDSQNKLNINDYVGQRTLNKETTQNNVKITVVSRETYMDYEIYNFKIENQSNKTIKLDAFEKTDSIYLEDSNGYKYNAYSHEILEDELIILPKRTFQMSIKFSNAYSSNTNIKKIVFSNLILDYDQYESEAKDKDVTEYVINL